MVGKKSGKALLREEGLQRTDNNLNLTTWPQVNMINQKNYYTEYLKREDQILALRIQNEEARNRMTKEAVDRDRARALNGRDALPGEEGEMDVDTEVGGEVGSNMNGQEILGAKTVVLHPGSQNLRIGMASDVLPRTIPMVIARKWKNANSEESGGEPSPKRLKVGLDEEEEEQPEKWFGDEFASEYATMASELKTRMQMNKRRVLPKQRELAVGFNKRTPPETISEHNDPHRIEWTELPANPKQAPDFFTGHDALRLPEDTNPKYKLFWPLKYGWLNERDYATKTLLIEDLSAILEEAIKAQLGLRKKADWGQYSCVFVIPDLYERVYVTTILDILIKDFGFGRICFIQESLAATFGAGYSQACIVDIGAEKTTIGCVEDGMIIDESRINLKYGGMDVTETFIKMMLFDWFPYADINLRRRHDFLLAEELKQKYVTMNEGEVTLQTYDFHLRVQGQNTRKYQFKTYDETMLAPIGYFRPTIFNNSNKLQGRRKLIDRSYDLYDGSPNDPFSNAQMAVIQYAAGLNLANAPSAAALSGDNLNGAGQASTPIPQQKPVNPLTRVIGNELEDTPLSSERGSPVPGEGTPANRAISPTAVNEGVSAGPSITDKAVETARQRDRVLPIMPLDMAVLESIAHAARGDDKRTRDFLGGIMVAGGGGKVAGLHQFLEERLRALRPACAKDIMIAPPPRDLDPQVLVWKGGSVYGKLVATNDSWIGKLEYDRLGARIMAYKTMWPW